MVPGNPWQRGKVSPAPFPCVIFVSPVAARGGAVSGPGCRRFIFPGEGFWGVQLRVPVNLAGKVGQQKGQDTPDRFLDACCSQSIRPPRKIADFPGELPIQTLFAKVPIYEPYGKVNERAYRGKLY